ncbi:penicillin-binding protein 2 [Candidatus Pelagibacter sp.]|nr:penicillin-binding protein 2 [Candidatus Pelagibacter sp.]
MINKEKRIIIEDQENDFLYEKSKSNLDIRFNRIAFIFFIFFIISLIYSIHLMHLGSRKSNIEARTNIKQPLNNLYRADIVDRNNKYLVKTVTSVDVGISPLKIIDEKKLIFNLRYIFPNENYVEIKKKIKKGNFFYFKRKVSNENYEKLMKLGDKSIEPRDNLVRIYPQKNLFSHIIGQIDNDNNGISGLEKSLDEKLKKVQDPIKLSVDKDIQFLIRDELIKFNRIFNTKGSSAILMNVNNGEILSLVSLPDFDLNKREKITDVNFINRATKGVYEFGSVFKTFTIAAAFNEKIFEPETKFVDLPKSLTCAGFPIREYDQKIPSTLTTEQILVRSGNIGSVKIGQEVGEENFKFFLSKLGILEKINFDIEEVGKPIKFNWGKCPLATASYGHGITTTLLQLVKAYSIITNGGFNIKPSLIKNNKKNKKKKEKVLNNGVSTKILPILRKVVTEGTASLANINGYEIGGKTGTAEKSSLGSYSKNKKINTFVSVFPTSKPKFVLAVMLDEPEINEEYIYEYRDGSNFKLKGTPRNTAGWNSVEVSGHIIEKIGPILATKYSEIN